MFEFDKGVSCFNLNFPIFNFNELYTNHYFHRFSNLTPSIWNLLPYFDHQITNAPDQHKDFQLREAFPQKNK